MIRMNLLPARPARFKIQPNILLFLFSSGVLVLAVGLIHFQFSKKQHQLQIIKAEKHLGLRQKQKELARRRQQAGAFTSIEKQIQTLRNMRGTQDFPVRLLAAVLSSVGSARISFHFLELMPDGTLQLKGVAFDAQTLAAYTRRLSRTAEIQEVRDIETTAHKVETFTFLHFSCRILPACQQTKNVAGPG